MPVSDVETMAARRAAEGGAEKRSYVRTIFSEIAPRYDLANHVLSLNIDRRWRRRAIAELGWERQPEGAFLDLCAGTLDLSAELARRPGFRGHVIGADFAEPMLRAGAAAGKVDAARVSPLTADALELPLADHSMAGAMVGFGIRNLADLDAGLREVHRVLVPGARFVILEFTTPRSRFVRWGYHAYFHNVLPLLGRAITGHPTAYSYLPRSVANFPIEEALAGRMSSAGFLDVRWQTLSFGIAAVHVGEKGHD